MVYGLARPRLNTLAAKYARRVLPLPAPPAGYVVHLLRGTLGAPPARPRLNTLVAGAPAHGIYCSAVLHYWVMRVPRNMLAWNTAARIVSARHSVPVQSIRPLGPRAQSCAPPRARAVVWVPAGSNGLMDLAWPAEGFKTRVYTGWAGVPRGAVAGF